MPGPMPADSNMAEKAMVDRFSTEVGHHMVRDGTNGLPGANQAINFDQPPFFMQGIGPKDEVEKYCKTT